MKCFMVNYVCCVSSFTVVIMVKHGQRKGEEEPSQVCYHASSIAAMCVNLSSVLIDFDTPVLICAI